jgi:hypothetical protein
MMLVGKSLGEQSASKSKKKGLKILRMVLGKKIVRIGDIWGWLSIVPNVVL